MENEGKLSQLMTQLREFLETQEWFLQIKTKWEELDPKSQLYLKVSGAAGSLLLVIIIMTSAVWSVHKLKREIADKDDLLTLIQNANDEMRRLKESAAAPPAADNTPWSAYFDAAANGAGLDKTTVSVSPEKPGTTTDTAKESLFDIALKHVSIRNVVRLAFALENGTRPVKVRNLAIDTKADPTGYMDATISVSAFSIVTANNTPSGK